MKYLITKKIETKAGFVYDSYFQEFGKDGLTGVIVTVMNRAEAKIYTSRKDARADLKKLSKDWTIEKVNP